MNRRSFLRSAAGLLVASTALAVPERKVWALDQTMVNPTPDHWLVPKDWIAGEFTLRDTPPTVLWKYDWVRVKGKYWGVVMDPIADSMHSEVMFATPQDDMSGIVRVPHKDIQTWQSLVGDTR